MTSPAWPWPFDPVPSGYSTPRLQAAQAALGNAGVSLSRASIELFEYSLLKELPQVSSKCDWFVVQGRAYLVLCSLDYTVQLAQGLGRDRAGRLILYGDKLELHQPWRNQGIGLKFKRSQLLMADQLGVAEIQVEANSEVGSYAWAAMGARPARPTDVRNELLARVGVMVSAMIWQPWQGQIVESALANDNSADFMLHLAELRVAGQRLGKELLVGTRHPPGRYSWEAYWDLGDSAQRSSVIAALT